jgi:hypothetical protein
VVSRRNGFKRNKERPQPISWHYSSICLVINTNTRENNFRPSRWLPPNVNSQSLKDFTKNMKMYGRFEIEVHAFLTSLLDGDEWSASSTGRFTPNGTAQVQTRQKVL